MNIFCQARWSLSALLLVALPLAGQTVPALKQIPSNLVESRPDLVKERAEIEAERASLHARVDAESAQCSNVEEGSPAYKACAQLRATLLAQLRAHIARSNAFNASVPDEQPAQLPALPPKPRLERTYIPSGNGLVGGVAWRFYAVRKPGEDVKHMCDVIKEQSRLTGMDYAGAVDCKKYDFVLGVAESVDWFTDVLHRASEDDLYHGAYSLETQQLLQRMSGRQFDELGCHSNGAMLCLAMLRFGATKATNVVLYGPQVTRESLEMWDQLVRDGTIKSVKVYINENDVVPGVTIAYADALKAKVWDGGHDPALFNIDVLKQTIQETAPRLAVQTFSCAFDSSNPVKCHEMSMYRSKVSCTGRSSGAPVPGTGLPGKGELPEPPLPCSATGGNP
jgi:hypothetical protein